MDVKESLSRNLKEILSKRGKKQAWLAEETGIKAQNISAYVRGNTLPDLSTVCLIAEKLDVSVDWLIGRKPEMHSSEVVPTTLKQHAKNMVLIADTFNAYVRQSETPRYDNPFGSIIIDFSNGAVSCSKNNKSFYEFVEFLDAWRSYRELYVSGKIEKSDYDLLTKNKLNKLNDIDIPAGCLLEEYIKARELPF